MTITKRISVFLVALLALFCTTGISSMAASPVSFSNVTSKTYTVKTKNAPWYTFAGQKVTVENTGSRAVTVIVYKTNGAIYKQVTCLQPGKSSTISLGTNATYKLAITPHYTSYGKISAYISSNKYVSSIK